MYQPPNAGILSQMGGAAPVGPKGRKPRDTSFYTYGGQPQGAIPGGAPPSLPRGMLAGAANFASGGASAGPGGGGRPDFGGTGEQSLPTAAEAPNGMLRALGGIRGPGTGRSDEIDAKLSDGEYVIDAEAVALLGDGSTEAGVKRLDEMREKLRSHKGKALAKGKISPNAKTPEQYLGGG